MFTGRVIQPGEPLFLAEDTEAAIALAEEEADTCPSCGMPKAWCRDDEVGRKRFDVAEDFCWATYRVGLRQRQQELQKVDDASRRARQIRATFRNGYEPDITAGLDLPREIEAPEVTS